MLTNIGRSPIEQFKIFESLSRSNSWTVYISVLRIVWPIPNAIVSILILLILYFLWYTYSDPREVGNSFLNTFMSIPRLLRSSHRAFVFTVEIFSCIIPIAWSNKRKRIMTLKYIKCSYSWYSWRTLPVNYLWGFIVTRYSLSIRHCC